METIILTAHVIIAIIIIGLILIQHGKGADAGATFGAGNAGTVFGAAGTGTFLSRLTAILTAIFFISSLTLAVIAKNKAADLFTLDTGAKEQTASQKNTSAEKDAKNKASKETADKKDINDKIKAQANEKVAGAYPSVKEKPAPKLVAPNKVTEKPVSAE